MSDTATAETAVSTPRLAALVVLRTDVGLVRSENQDFAAFTTSREERSSHPGGRLLIVADGMGGHRGGATASRLATEVVKRQYLDSETGDPAAALRDALTRANARIHAEAQSNADLRGMGTTTSALVLRNDRAWFAHVGDSRIYRVRGGEIEQLTEDHSLVASMVREGLLTAKEAENHPRRNVLQRSMGVTEEVEIDVRGPFDLQVGDVFILCSDGLHGVVKESEIKEFADRPLDEAADNYVKMALERGGPDNVTVLVARIVRADDIGDETLADSPYDETVRDEIADQSQKTTAKIPAMKEPPPELPAETGGDGASGGLKPAAPQDGPAAPQDGDAKVNEQPPKPGFLKRLFFL